MLNQKLQLKLSQKLSPQQIQLMKLIQLTTTELEQKIINEIEENPALETGSELQDEQANDSEIIDENVNVDDYLDNESGDLNQSYYSNQEEEKNFQRKSSVSFHQFLDNQSKNLILSDSEKPICEFLIGSIDESGYLRREIEDIAFTRKELRDFSGWSDWQVREGLKQLEELEYISKVAGRNASRIIYEMLVDVREGKRQSLMLTDPKELEKILSKKKTA